MKNFYKAQYDKIKQVLDIENIISIRFSNTKPRQYTKHKDTACTALSRIFNKKISTYIDRDIGQLCSGGNHFLNIETVSKKELCDIYIKKESVFQNNSNCIKFLKSLPKYPIKTRNKYILFTPLDQEKSRSNIIMFLTTPAQTGRIIGLLNYKKYSEIKITPNQPTCVSIFAPLSDNKLHLNFIDYYDRYHQGVIDGKKIWPEDSMIVSMTTDQFDEVCDNISKSPQGSFVPDLTPQKVDII